MVRHKVVIKKSKNRLKFLFNYRWTGKIRYLGGSWEGWWWWQGGSPERIFCYLFPVKHLHSPCTFKYCSKICDGCTRNYRQCNDWGIIMELHIQHSIKAWRTFQLCNDYSKGIKVKFLQLKRSYGDHSTTEWSRKGTGVGFALPSVNT